jgi:uncharacterized membrane protein YedE/YeeE
MARKLAALVAGIVFGVGLTVSGMTEPDNILAFLRLGPAWNPALILVLGSAFTVTAIGYALVRRRSGPLFESSFSVPQGTAIDARLLGGAGLFGVGWGLSGYCPGPAIVGAFGLDPRATVFFMAFLVGAFGYRLLQRREARSVLQLADG